MTTVLSSAIPASETQHRLIDRDRRRAVVSFPEPAAGRYLGIHADDELIVLPLERSVTVIGRGLGCDIRFEDRTLSRRHAMIIDRDGTTLVADDRSTNGTWLNGKRVNEAVLRHGDTILLGDVRLDYLEPELDHGPNHVTSRVLVHARRPDAEAPDADTDAATTRLIHTS
jgi:pSer/pThr/pTyr-binding forkhead associated (FHA) protein